MLVFLISIFIFIISLVAIAIFHIHHIRTLKENEFKYNSHINSLTNQIENEKKSTRTKQQDVSDSVTSINTETQQHTNDANKHFIGTEKENTFESIKDNQEKLFAQGQLLQEQSSSIQRNKDKIHDLSQHSTSIKASLSALDDITTENQLQKQVNENSKIRREINQELSTLQRQLTNFKKGVLDNQPEYEDNINEVMKNINLVENELINQHVLDSSIHFNLSDIPSDNKELTKQRNAYNKVQNSNQFLTRELALAQSNLNVLKTSKSNVLEEIEDINSSIQTYSDDNTLVSLSNQIYGWTMSNNTLQQELDVMNVAISTHQQLSGSNIDAKTSLSNQLVECHASLSDYQSQWASVQEKLENEKELVKLPVIKPPVVDGTLVRKSSFAYAYHNIENPNAPTSWLGGWGFSPYSLYKYPFTQSNLEFTDVSTEVFIPYYSVLSPSGDKVHSSHRNIALYNGNYQIVNAFANVPDTDRGQGVNKHIGMWLTTELTSGKPLRGVYEFVNGSQTINMITIQSGSNSLNDSPRNITIEYYNGIEYVFVSNPSSNGFSSNVPRYTSIDITFDEVTSNKFRFSIYNDGTTTTVGIESIELSLMENVRVSESLFGWNNPTVPKNMVHMEYIHAFWGDALPINKPNSSIASGVKIPVTNYKSGTSTTKYVDNYDSRGFVQNERASSIANVSDVRFVLSHNEALTVTVYVTNDHKIHYSTMAHIVNYAPIEDASWLSKLTEDGKENVGIRSIFNHHHAFFVILEDGSMYKRHAIIDYKGTIYYIEVNDVERWQSVTIPTSITKAEVLKMWSNGFSTDLQPVTNVTNREILFTIPKPFGESDRYFSFGQNEVFTEKTASKNWTDGNNPTGNVNPTTIEELTQNYHLVSTFRISNSTTNAIFEHKNDKSIRLTYNYNWGNLEFFDQAISSLNTLLSGLGNGDGRLNVGE
jgi:hypothetical protein